MRRSFWVSLLWVLAACTNGIVIPPGEPLPEYIVMITTGMAMGKLRCTGVALDQWSVLTMRHCVEGRRVVTQRGQIVYRKEVVATSEDLDLALYSLKEPLELQSFATIGPRIEGEVGAIFGVCPWFFPHDPRYVQYLQTITARPLGAPVAYEAEVWVALRDEKDDAICGGDSGGPLIQDGVVRGMVSAVKLDFVTFSGRDVLVIPGREISGWLEDIHGGG